MIKKIIELWDKGFQVFPLSMYSEKHVFNLRKDIKK